MLRAAHRRDRAAHKLGEEHEGHAKKFRVAPEPFKCIKGYRDIAAVVPKSCGRRHCEILLVWRERIRAATVSKIKHGHPVHYLIPDGI